MDHNNYGELIDNNFIFINNMLVYDYNDIIPLLLNPDFSLGTSSIPSIGDTYTESYDYYFHEITKNFTPNHFPLLSTSINYNIDNNCSPTAGTELVMYFDSIYSNIIPNFSPTYSTTNVNKFKDHNYLLSHSSDKTIVKTVHDELASTSYMSTNNWSYLGISMDGTSPVLFYDGLESYFEERGFILSNNPIVGTPEQVLASNGSNINFSFIKSEIDSGNPLVVQLGIPTLVEALLGNVTPLYELVLDPESDINYTSDPGINNRLVTYKYTVEGVPHTTVGYGYYDGKFTYKNALLHDAYIYEKFIILANGWGGYSYVNIEEYNISILYSLEVDEKTEPTSEFTSSYSSGGSVYYRTSTYDSYNTVDFSKSVVKVYDSSGLLVYTKPLATGITLQSFPVNPKDNYYTLKIVLYYQMGSETTVKVKTADTTTVTLNVGGGGLE